MVLKRFLLYIFISVFLVFAFFTGILISLLDNNFVDFSSLEKHNFGKPSILLDDEGNEWARFELDRRDPIDYNDLPQHLIQAFIASEDREFFNHGGISIKGILRSIIVNIRYGRILQGASTITQQLVKLMFFDSKKTFKRKLKEQFLSLLIEKQFSKQQILQTYLNYVYFGCGIYGVAAASQRFFGKSVYEITIDEAALLAAVVRSPAHYCPLLCPLSAQKRRNLILGIMKDMGFINKDEYEKHKLMQLNLFTDKKNYFAKHLKETIRLFIEDKFGKEILYTGGLKVQTTLNKKIQNIAQHEFNNQFKKLRKDIPGVDGGLISIEPKTGEIKALIGGVDFAQSKFNRALQAKRQMGSIFKPVVYAATIKQGQLFTDIEVDSPLEIEKLNWTPQNNTRIFEGSMTLAKALSHSNNIIAIKTLLNVGCQTVANLALKFRLNNVNLYPSLALGCIDATLKEAVGEFNVFANNGMYIEPHFIKWIKDEWGKKIWKVNLDQEQILDPAVSDQVTKVLSIGINRNIKKYNQSFLGDAIGKTGTTNDSRTCWFSGATPHLTTSIYIGLDNNKPMGKNVYPTLTVFPIWVGLYKQLNLDNRKFNFDPSLQEIFINWNTGQIVRDNADQDNPDLDIVPILVPKTS